MKQLLLLRKALIVLLLALPFANTLFAQIAYTQGFESNTFPTGGWSLGYTNGNNLWSHRTTGTNPTCTPHSGTGMARFNSHTALAGRTQALISPLVDYSYLNGSTATFSLWVYRDTGVATIGDSITIAVNTVALDSGSTPIGSIARSISINLPDTKDSSGWYQYSFNIPASFNTNTNYIIVNGTAETGNSIYIDDVSWMSYPTPCSGTPNAGTVNANSALLCGDSGSTNLSLSGATAGFNGLRYQWLSGPSANGPWTYFDSVPATNTGVITTTTYYRCVLTCSFSGLSDSTVSYAVAVSANPVPVVTINPTTINFCVGGSPVALSATGAAIYSWSPSTGLNTTSDSTVLSSPANTTHYTVVGTDINGCSATARATVNVRNPPALTLTATPDTVCIGDTVNLTATTTGFVNGPVFTWTPDSIVGASVVVTPTGNTLYRVKLTSNTGCPATDSIMVYTNPLSVANFGYTTNGHTVTFIDSSTNTTSWHWSFGGGIASTNQNPVYTFLTDGTDTVQLITSGICSNQDTISKIITVYGLGVNQPSGGASISVYPNPAENFAVVEFNQSVPMAQLNIINVLGDIVASYNVAAGNYKQQIDLTKIAAGVYTLRFTSGSQSVTQQLIKQ